MEARIDRLTGDGAPPSLTPERVIEGLGSASHWVNWSLTYWADMIEKWKSQPNRFLSYRQLDDNRIDATPGGEPLIAYWMLPADRGARHPRASAARAVLVRRVRQLLVGDDGLSLSSGEHELPPRRARGRR